MFNHRSCCCGCTCIHCAGASAQTQLVTIVGIGLNTSCFPIGGTAYFGKWQSGSDVNGSYCLACVSDQDAFPGNCVAEATSTFGVLDIYSDNTCSTLVETINIWTVQHSLNATAESIQVIPPATSIVNGLNVCLGTSNSSQIGLPPYDCLASWSPNLFAQGVLASFFDITSSPAAVVTPNAC